MTLPVASVGSLLRNVYGLAFDRLFRLGYKEEDSLNVIVRDVPEKKQTSSADVGTRLVLLRHAKTVWDREKDTPDHDRMLSIQGKDEARVIGAELSRLGWIPDVVLCSDAVRTVQTLSLLGIPDDGSMQTTCMDSLYYAVTGDEMALAVSDALAEKSLVENPTLLVVCHNPGCEELVEQLCGHRPKMGTGCAALLDFNYQQDSYAADESQPFRLSEQESRWSLVQLLQPSVLSSPESSSQE